MGIHDDLVGVAIFEERVPALAEVEGILEDEVQMGSLLLHHLPDISVEVHKGVTRSCPPWLIDWFEGVHGWMVSPFVKESLSDIFGPLDILLVDVII